MEQHVADRERAGASAARHIPRHTWLGDGSDRRGGVAGLRHRLLARSHRHSVSIGERPSGCSNVSYNTGTVAILVFGGFGLRLSGIGLWPAALLHAAMGPWCTVRLGERRAN